MSNVRRSSSFCEAKTKASARQDRDLRGASRGCKWPATLWTPKRRKARRVFGPCERRPRFGEPIQIDASHHDWSEGRAPRYVLRGAKITLRHFLDGAMQARFKDRELAFTAYGRSGAPLRSRTKRPSTPSSPTCPRSRPQRPERPRLPRRKAVGNAALRLRRSGPQLRAPLPTAPHHREKKDILALHDEGTCSLCVDDNQRRRRCRSALIMDITNGGSRLCAIVSGVKKCPSPGLRRNGVE